jgi:cation transport ATPase
MPSTAQRPDSAQARAANKNGVRRRSRLLLARGWSYPKETWIAVAAIHGIGAYLVCGYVFSYAIYSHWILIAVLISGGVPLLIDLTKNAFGGEFGSDFLAGLSIITSAVIGEYLAGSIVVLMLSGGNALDQ